MKAFLYNTVRLNNSRSRRMAVMRSHPMFSSTGISSPTAVKYHQPTNRLNVLARVVRYRCPHRDGEVVGAAFPPLLLGSSHSRGPNSCLCPHSSIKRYSCSSAFPHEVWHHSRWSFWSNDAYKASSGTSIYTRLTGVTQNIRLFLELFWGLSIPKRLNVPDVWGNFH